MPPASRRWRCARSPEHSIDEEARQWQRRRSSPEAARASVSPPRPIWPRKATPSSPPAWSRKAPLPEGVSFVRTDVSDAAALKALMDGPADISALVNCAGIIRQQREWQAEDFQRRAEHQSDGDARGIDGRTAEARAGRRRHRQHRLHVGLLRLGPVAGICGQQERRRCPDALHGRRLGQPRRARQCRGAGLGRHAHGRAGQERSRARTAHHRAHPDGPLGRSRARSRP